MKLFYKNIRIILLLLSAIFIHAQADESITEKLEEEGYLYVRETQLSLLFEDEEGYCGFIDKKSGFLNCLVMDIIVDTRLTMMDLPLLH